MSKMIYVNLIKNAPEEKEQEQKAHESIASGIARKISGAYKDLSANAGRYSRYAGRFAAAAVLGAGLLITSASREGFEADALHVSKAQAQQKQIQEKDKQASPSLDDYVNSQYGKYNRPNENENQANEGGLIQSSQPNESQLNEKPAVLDYIEAKKGDYVLVVNKETQKAQLYKLDFVPVDTTSVSTGRNPGDKQKLGDNKTPKGIFEVVSVEDSSNWFYEGKHSYGPRFARLSAGSWDSNGNYNPAGLSDIGVHGTDEPEKLGTPVSHGCVRLASNIIDEYVTNGYVKKGTKVAIVDNSYDVALAPSRTLSIYLANNNVSNNVSSSNNSDNNAKQFSVDTNYLKELGKKSLEEKNLEQIITKPIKSQNKVIDNSGLGYSSASAKKDYESDQKEKILKDAQKVVDNLNQMIPNQNFVYKQTEAKAKNKMPNTTQNKIEKNGESKSKGNEVK
jgi:hypothetical protein